MKIIITICCFALCFATQAQDYKYIFSDFDQSLISLWTAADKQDYRMCNNSLQTVQKASAKVMRVLKSNNTVHFDQEGFKKHIHIVEKLLVRYTEKRKFEKLKFFSYDLLYENYSLRSCLSNVTYPLDQLIELKQSYDLVHEAVDDPMFNLLEWFEFIELVDNMVTTFEKYNCVDNEQIFSFFPKFDDVNHERLKKKADSCLNDFIGSMDSGYQSNFEAPCDDLGNAIDQILTLYK